MTITNRLSAYAATAVMAAAIGVVATSGSAEAHDSGRPASCPSLHLCGYVGIAYNTGEGFELNPSRPAGTCENAAFINQWSGVYNNSGRRITVYKNTNCSGSAMDYPNGQGDDQLSIDHVGWDNDIASYRFR